MRIPFLAFIILAGCGGVTVEPSKQYSSRMNSQFVALASASSKARSIVLPDKTSSPHMAAVLSVYQQCPEFGYRGSSGLARTAGRRVSIRNANLKFEGFTLLGLTEFENGDRCFIEVLIDSNNEKTDRSNFLLSAADD